MGVLMAAARGQPAVPDAGPAQTAGVMTATAAEAAGILPPAPQYDVNNPPEGVFDEEWTEVRLGGQKAGYAHEVLRRQGGLIFTDTRAVIRVAREEDAVELTVESSTEETLAGEPRAFRSATTTASQPVVVEGRGDGVAFNVTLQSGAYTEKQVVTLPAGTLMTWGAERRQRIEGLAQRTHYEFPLYEPEQDMLKPMPVSVVVGAKEKVNVHGVVVEATRLDERQGEPGSAGVMNEVSWVDDMGDNVKMLMPLGGFTMEMTSATQAEALAEYLPADIFSASLIDLAQPVSANATSVTYRLQRRDGQALPATPESATEHGELLPGGAARITLARPSAGTGNGVVLKGPELAPYLARNSFLDTQDPEVRRLAAQAGGPEGAPPAEVAQRLRDFVAGYISKKDLSVGFATASEVAQSREGDCTEHAVLLAALGRVRGLPSRVVAGLAYVPEYQGKQAILGYHMWAQFYLDGRWVDYDAALPEIPGPPRRLGLVASDLNSESLADFSLGLLDWMAAMQVTVEGTAGAKP